MIRKLKAYGALLLPVAVAAGIISHSAKKREARAAKGGASKGIDAARFDRYGNYLGSTTLRINGRLEYPEPDDMEFQGFLSADCAPYTKPEKTVVQTVCMIKTGNGTLIGGSVLLSDKQTRTGFYTLYTDKSFSKYILKLDGYGFRGYVVAPAKGEAQAEEVIHSLGFAGLA